jgi:hypothetical protein
MSKKHTPAVPIPVEEQSREEQAQRERWFAECLHIETRRALIEQLWEVGMTEYTQASTDTAIVNALAYERFHRCADMLSTHRGREGRRVL